MKISLLADHPETIPALAKWFYAEWSYLVPGRSEQDVAASIAERATRRGIPIALVAFEGDELIGSVCLKLSDMDTRPELTPWLAGLYVKESWRNRGVGSALVKAIEKQALEQGVKQLFLYTPESERFYAALGWQVLERTDYHDVPVTIMEKPLSPAVDTES